MVEQSEKFLTAFTIQLGLTSQTTEFINTAVRTTWFPRQYYYITSRIDSVLLFNTITLQSDRFMHQTFIDDRNSGGQIALGTLKSGNSSPACWKDYKFCLRFSLLLILHKSAVKYWITWLAVLTHDGWTVNMKGAKLNKTGNVRLTLTLRHVREKIVAVENIKYYIAHWMQQWHNTKIAHLELILRFSSKM
jgi:hypothetical protein